MFSFYYNSHPLFQLFDILEDFYNEPSKQSRRINNVEKFFNNGILHRLDGPAVITYDSKDPTKIIKEEYFLEGERKTKEEVESYKQQLEDERIHHINLGGRIHKVSGKKLKEIEKQLGL